MVIALTELLNWSSQSLEKGMTIQTSGVTTIRLKCGKESAVIVREDYGVAIDVAWELVNMLWDDLEGNENPASPEYKAKQNDLPHTLADTTPPPAIEGETPARTIGVPCPSTKDGEHMWKTFRPGELIPDELTEQVNVNSIQRLPNDQRARTQRLCRICTNCKLHQESKL